MADFIADDAKSIAERLKEIQKLEGREDVDISALRRKASENPIQVVEYNV